jgi:5'-deoxynucleotidase YfbR-like HD superfamily hydrolase
MTSPEVLSRTWMQLRSGAPFQLLDPDPHVIRLRDIGVALSREGRFANHTCVATGVVEPPYSVAQHSVLVASLMPPKASAFEMLMAALHDAHEYVTGDITSPMQDALGELIRQRFDVAFNPVKALQQRVQVAVEAAAGLTERLLYCPADEFGELERKVKKADLLALAVEKRDFMATPLRDWPALPPCSHVPTQTLMTPSAARGAFIDLVTRLIDEAGVKPLASFWE